VTDSLAIWADDVHKSFGGTAAVAGATVSVGRGEIVSLLGPSGSGKTTLLRVVAGLEVPDRGTVAIGGRIVTGAGAWVEPERRRIGMVFQDGALFPHLTVARNVGFGDVREGRVEECLGLVGLADRAGSYPHELSGGERQRVALARALAPEPEVVLLDEPFASLDAGLRLALREEVVAILRAARASTLVVTHDQEEALSISDAVVVLRKGRVVQSGAPEELYAHPSSRWVAEFVGDADVLPGTASGGVVDCELGRFATDASLTGAVDVVVRPEALTLAALDGDDRCGATRTGGVRATVVGRSFYGADQLVRLRLASGTEVRCRTIGGPQWQQGDDVHVEVAGAPTVIVADPVREDDS
jgi:iron(III) transport system ATP-binding protein